MVALNVHCYSTQSHEFLSLFPSHFSVWEQNNWGPGQGECGVLGSLHSNNILTVLFPQSSQGFPMMWCSTGLQSLVNEWRVNLLKYLAWPLFLKVLASWFVITHEECQEAQCLYVHVFCWLGNFLFSMFLTCPKKKSIFSHSVGLDLETWASSYFSQLDTFRQKRKNKLETGKYRFPKVSLPIRQLFPSTADISSEQL